MKKKIIKQIDPSEVIDVMSTGKSVFEFDWYEENVVNTIHRLFNVTLQRIDDMRYLYFTVDEVEIEVEEDDQD